MRHDPLPVLAATAPPFDQPPVEAVPEKIWDAVIIGGGPAGAMAALCLARAGRRVLVLERHRFPRDKVCGDALIPDALACLDRHGLVDAVIRLGATYRTLSVYGPARGRLDLTGRFVTVPRERFDAWLASKAVESGATIAQATVSGATSSNERVTIRCQGVDRVIAARYAVLATGADIGLAQASGLRPDPRPSAVALRCYVTSSIDLDRLIVSYDRAVLPGYAWIFPLGGGVFNAGCGTTMRDGRVGVNLRRIFETFCRVFPEAHAMMANATHVTALKGARLRCGLDGTTALVHGRIVSAGEASGTTFPLTGEGIGKAMETGELAAAAIDQALATGDSGRLAIYADRVDRELRRKYLGYRTAERWLSWPWVADALVGRANRAPRLRALLNGILNETVDPRAVFSARGIVSAWLRDGGDAAAAVDVPDGH